jgi:hypothetical protein
VRSPLAVGQLEALAGFHRGEDADQAVGDLVPLHDGPNAILLADRRVQVNVGAPAALGHRFGVLLDALGVPVHEGAEILDPQPLAGEESFHGRRPAQGKMAFEENPVETGNRAGDLVPVFCDKLVHGVLLSFGCMDNNHGQARTPLVL